MLEKIVLSELAKIVFNDSIIPEIHKGYNDYLQQKNNGSLAVQKGLKQGIGEINRQMDNIVSVISQTPSNVLVEKLNELDARKKALEEGLYEIQNGCEKKLVSAENLAIAFANARQMLESKQLSNIKVLIERFVHKIIINGDEIEIQFNLNVGSRVTSYSASVFTQIKTPQLTREDDVVMFLSQPCWLATCGGEGEI